MLFDNYARGENSPIATMAEMAVNGLSTSKIARVIETLCGKLISKSAVSDVCQGLDKGVTAFCKRPIEGKYPFLTVNATYFEVRETFA